MFVHWHGKYAFYASFSVYSKYLNFSISVNRREKKRENQRAKQLWKNAIISLYPNKKRLIYFIIQA